MNDEHRMLDACKQVCMRAVADGMSIEMPSPRLMYLCKEGVREKHSVFLVNLGEDWQDEIRRRYEAARAMMAQADD